MLQGQPSQALRRIAPSRLADHTCVNRQAAEAVSCGQRVDMKTLFRSFCIVFALATMAAGADEGAAQGWGWGNRGNYDPPGWGQQPAYGGPPPQPSQGYSAPGGRCAELEAQLNGGSPNAGLEQLPRIENDMRQADANYQKAQSDADRSDCYEDMFLFGRSLRRTPRCVEMDRQAQAAKATLMQLKAQRDAIVRGSSPRARRDDLIAELARNRCGDQYAREYDASRSRNSSIFSFFSNEESSPDEMPRSPGAAAAPPSFFGGSSSFRTLCVRECDGFYFPISDATTEAHFRDDDAKCKSLCAGPAELFYHRLDQDVDQMISLSGRPYTSMPYAFRNRKVYIRGCSCNASEYSPEEIAKAEQALKMSKRADASGKGDAAFARRMSQAVQSAPAPGAQDASAPLPQATPPR